jgi:hypothetical protein
MRNVTCTACGIASAIAPASIDPRASPKETAPISDDMPDTGVMDTIFPVLILYNLRFPMAIADTEKRRLAFLKLETDTIKVFLTLTPWKHASPNF